MNNSGLQIGEVAARSGVSAGTIRYYERRKLLPRTSPSDGGFRIFLPEIGMLFIKHAQEMGRIKRG